MGDRVHLPVTSPATSAFPKVPWVSFPRPTAQRLPNGGVISRLQSFVYLQASEFAATQVVPTAGHRFRCSGQPWHLHLSRTCVVTFACIRYASRPNRAIDGEGLSPPRFAALPAAPGLSPHQIMPMSGVHISVKVAPSGRWTSRKRAALCLQRWAHSALHDHNESSSLI